VTELSDAAIAGVYVSEQGDLAARSQPDLYWECVQGALADAGVTLADVDGLIGPAPEGFGVRHALPGAAVADIVGHPLRFHAQTGVGAASQAAGVGLAALAVANGLAEVVIVPTAAAGSSAGYTAADRNAAVEHMAKLGSPFEAVMGTTRVADFALVARRRMHEYGTTSEQLAAIAVGVREYATLNPNAMYRDPITVDDVVGSRMIADPLHKLDCCAITDGGGAFIMTTADLAQPPVYVLGAAGGQTHWNISQQTDFTSCAGAQAGPEALAQAGVTHDDVDMLMFYDSFTITCLILLESIGFVPKGEGGPFVAEGHLKRGGKWPLNTDGGGLSSCHPGMRGIFLIIEAVRQLRGQAGAAQVPDCEVALCAGSGGWLSCIGVNVLGKERA
jgi:acetyl-CoA acetyltransferase